MSHDPAISICTVMPNNNLVTGSNQYSGVNLSGHNLLDANSSLKVWDTSSGAEISQYITGNSLAQSSIGGLAAVNSTGELMAFLGSKHIVKALTIPAWTSRVNISLGAPVAPYNTESSMIVLTKINGLAITR